MIKEDGISHPLFFKINTPGKIRTCDPLIRSQILYPAELRVLGNYELNYHKSREFRNSSFKKSLILKISADQFH